MRGDRTSRHEDAYPVFPLILLSTVKKPRTIAQFFFSEPNRRKRSHLLYFLKKKVNGAHILHALVGVM